MKCTILLENKTYRENTFAEHGLSVYIESNDKKILFDAGASEAFAKNAVSLDVDLSQVDFAVVSHGHYDHTGGFPKFCEINKNAPIYLHKNAFRQSYGFENGVMDDYICGIPWNNREKDLILPRIKFTDGPIFVDDNIAITGTIIKSPNFIPTERFVYRNENGEFIDDDLSHEQCLVIREDDGLYIFSGCSHTGVLNAVNTAKSLFPEERVAMLLAGMHLYNSTELEREKVIDTVLDAGVETLVPVHCTGIDAILSLKRRLGDKCILAGVGDQI